MEALQSPPVSDQVLQDHLGVFDLPPELAEVEAALVESRSMLELGDDWDDEGSPGYEEATWLRAAQFVADSATRFWRSVGTVPPTPWITNGPDGSVDIVWEAGSRRVLISVPAQDDFGAAFYGRDLLNPRRVVQGEIDLGGVNEWIVVWLTE